MGNTRRRLKILIVDDSASVQDAARWILESAGYEVIAIQTPFAFVQTLNAEKPALVLMDVSMPGLRGDALVQIAGRYDGHRCPIVLFSAQPIEELERIVESSVGVAGYIPKSLDTLVADVARFLVET